MNYMCCNCLDANGSRFDWRPKGDSYFYFRKRSWIVTFRGRFGEKFSYSSNKLIVKSLLRLKPRHQHAKPAKLVCHWPDQHHAAQMGCVYSLRRENRRMGSIGGGRIVVDGGRCWCVPWQCERGSFLFLLSQFPLACCFVHEVAQKFVFIKRTDYFLKL